MTIRLKPAHSSAPEAPFSWDDLPLSPVFSDSSPISIPGSPPTSWLPAKDMKVFGVHPLRPEYGNGIVRCKDCNKPVIRSAFSEHIENCKKIRALQQTPQTKKGGKVSDLKKGTKRKADEIPDGETSPKKKKAAPKVTKGRFKGPIDYDKQCGVINDKHLPCSRSLTCKSHAMGAKRAVLGRSRPYDELLLDWQREHNPNFVEPVKRETKKEKKEKKDKEREEKRKMMDAKKAATLAAKKKKGASAPVGMTDVADENMEEDIDSEVEMDAMIHSLKVAREAGQVAVPLATYEEHNLGSWFVVRRERLRCCRDQLLGALMGGRGGIGGVPSIVRAVNQ